MKRIWSPWRLEYILRDKVEDCVFCVDDSLDDDRALLVLYRGQRFYVMMNRYPYNNGHLMVIPYAHVDRPTRLPTDAQSELMQYVNMCVEVLDEAMQPDGYNVGMNLGTSAGAGIKDHLHMHIVPRWAGDTNFMPVLSETRVIIESLEQTYLRLRPLFDAYDRTKCVPGGQDATEGDTNLESGPTKEIV